MTGNSLIHRQVHPSWVQQGRVTSQAFRPTPKDEKRLSAYDGDRISAESAWRHYVQELGYNSSGVLAVVVSECKAQQLAVTPDPEPFPEHVLIDFTGLSENEIKKKAKLLKAAAEARGWQYRVENPH